ncbi:glutathione S-transferase N-terminal domain-containing protein [Comamonas sp. NyZ500]|uniref:glutathione S-transferase N-terminal domain-containing protein n=1 Tax=Comamonas sp. NyZ500 TaxID=2795732 RepID=UPI00351C83EB
MLHLYSDSSPNGFKATIALEELSLPYQLHHVRIDEGEHRRSDFLALNPHGRIPVLKDCVCLTSCTMCASMRASTADQTFLR